MSLPQVLAAGLGGVTVERRSTGKLPFGHAVLGEPRRADLPQAVDRAGHRFGRSVSKPVTEARRRVRSAGAGREKQQVRARTRAGSTVGSGRIGGSASTHFLLRLWLIRPSRRFCRPGRHGLDASRPCSGRFAGHCPPRGSGRAAASGAARPAPTRPPRAAGPHASPDRARRWQSH